MSSSAAVDLTYQLAALQALAPDPDLTVSEWADRHRVLVAASSAEIGQYRTGRTPYMREVMDELSPSSEIEDVSLQKGTQLGGTEGGNNLVGFVIHMAPAPIMYVQPTVDTVKAYSKQRIAPMIEACPALAERIKPARSRDSGNTVLMKDFPGGFLRMTGANSAVGLRSMPIKILILDEIDAYPADVEGEGDPVVLATKRTATYAPRGRKIFKCSSPKIRNLSRIEKSIAETDKRRYFLPCPVCGHMAPLEWHNIRWPEHNPERAHFVCDECGQPSDERCKTAMLANGVWRPTAVGKPGKAGFIVSALYSPLGWYSWAEAAQELLVAKHTQDRERLKTWTNTVLAETYEDEGDSIIDVPLFQRREKYEAEVPGPAVILTAGVDVHDNRIEMEVVGWNRYEESWGIDYRTLHGDTKQAAVWKDLSDALEQTYEHESGHTLRIAAAAIDSGYLADIVYRFTDKRSTAHRYAVKGMAGAGRPIVMAPTGRRTGRGRRKINVWFVGVDEAKGLLYSRIHQPDPGPGYCHFPLHPGYDVEYFDQLAAEQVKTRYTRGFPRREWVKVGPRNEALDCRVYAMAALYILQPTWPALEARLKRKLKDKPDGRPREPTAREIRRMRRKGKGWTEGWR